MVRKNLDAAPIIFLASEGLIRMRCRRSGSQTVCRPSSICSAIRAITMPNGVL